MFEQGQGMVQDVPWVLCVLIPVTHVIVDPRLGFRGTMPGKHSPWF